MCEALGFIPSNGANCFTEKPNEEGQRQTPKKSELIAYALYSKVVEWGTLLS